MKETVKTDEDKWFWALSRDEERWSGPFNTRELAIADAAAHKSSEGHECPTYVTQGSPVRARSALPSPASIVEQMEEWAGDNTGADDDIFEVSKEGLAALELLLETWADTHVLVRWYDIDTAAIEEVVGA